MKGLDKVLKRGLLVIDRVRSESKKNHVYSVSLTKFKTPNGEVDTNFEILLNGATSPIILSKDKFDELSNEEMIELHEGEVYLALQFKI